jgi:hypothetical protein
VKSRTAAVEIAPRDLETLDTVWASGLGDAYEAYRGQARDTRVALAAALVETGVTLQGVGSHVAAPGELLLGDLCLARASRLLADVADQGLQVGFARVVERITTEAAAGREVADVRQLLRSVIGSQR